MTPANDSPRHDLPDATTSGAANRRTVLTGLGALTGGAALAAGALANSGPATAATAAPPKGQRFRGKVVQITGGTSGIGEATARAFAAQGAKVAFCGRRAELGRKVEQEIRAAGGDAKYIPADVRLPASVASFVNAAARHYGRLDIAFNNAGVQISAPIHETSVAAWDNLMNTNLRGVFLAMQSQIPHLRRAGGGVIIVNSSIGAIVGRPQLSTYQASKSALLALVKTAALEYGGDGIRINAVLPGITDTAMIRPPGMDDATWKKAKTAIGQLNVDGLKRIAEPAEIAQAVLAMSTDELAYLTGAQLPVDGGITAGRPLQLPPQR